MARAAHPRQLADERRVIERNRRRADGVLKRLDLLVARAGLLAQLLPELGNSAFAFDVGSNNCLLALLWHAGDVEQRAEGRAIRRWIAQRQSHDLSLKFAQNPRNLVSDLRADNVLAHGSFERPLQRFRRLRDQRDQHGRQSLPHQPIKRFGLHLRLARHP